MPKDLLWSPGSLGSNLLSQWKIASSVSTWSSRPTIFEYLNAYDTVSERMASDVRVFSFLSVVLYFERRTALSFVSGLDFTIWRETRK